MQPIYIKYSPNRFPKFQIETSIIVDHSTKYVVKRALSEEAYPHIESIYRGFNFFKDAILDDRIKQPAIIEKQDDRIVFEFVEGENLSRSIFGFFLKKDKARYLDRIDQYHELLFHSLKTVKQIHFNDGMDVFFKDVDMASIEDEKYFFPYAFMDVAPDNLIATADGSYCYIDYEWIFPATFPVSFVFFRSFFLFYIFTAAGYGIENFLPFDDLMCRYGISKSQMEQYSKIEKNIHNYISGEFRDNRDGYLKKRVSLDDLTPCLDGTYQRLLETQQRMMNEYEMKFQEWTREREDIISRCEQQSKTIQEIMNSRSWRLTRPLRWLKGMRKA